MNRIEAVPTRYVGTTLWVGAVDSNGDAWNGSAFVAFTSDAEIAGAITPTRLASDNRYSVTIPAGVLAANYTLFWHAQQGGSPASTDPVCNISEYPVQRHIAVTP